MTSPDPSVYPDADPGRRYVRLIRPKHVTKNLDTGEITLVVPTAYQFNPELSIYDVQNILDAGATLESALGIPPNGAVEVPAAAALNAQALLKQTSHEEDPVLGPAHCSIYCVPSSKSERADLRDVLTKDLVWVALPTVPTVGR